MIQSLKPTRLLTLLGAAAMAVLLLAPAANAAEPKEGYKQFAGCPSAEENPEIAICMRTLISGGHFNMGNKEVPIENPITLTGGTNIAFENFSANAEGGLTPVKQLVPGGIIGLTGLDWLVNFLGLEALQLFAVTEGAGLPDLNPFAEPIELPIKVHLINPVLGNNCYIGSFTEPIELNLITGTTEPPEPNEPISGTPPELEFDFETGIVSFVDGVFVDNSFAAPGANGCKLILFGFIPISINGLVNTASGLPSPAGTNETVQEFDIETVESSLVY